MVTLDARTGHATFICDQCPRTVGRRRLTVRIIRPSQRFPDGRWIALPRGWAYRRLEIWSTPEQFRSPVPAHWSLYRVLCPRCRRRPSPDAVPGTAQDTYLVEVGQEVTL